MLIGAKIKAQSKCSLVNKANLKDKQEFLSKQTLSTKKLNKVFRSRISWDSNSINSKLHFKDKLQTNSSKDFNNRISKLWTKQTQWKWQWNLLINHRALFLHSARIPPSINNSNKVTRYLLRRRVWVWPKKHFRISSSLRNNKSRLHFHNQN